MSERTAAGAAAINGGGASIEATPTLGGSDTPPDSRRVRQLLEALEVTEKPMTRCPSCGGETLCRWGTSHRNLQRWSCHGCGRTLTAATGTPLANVHSLDKLRAVAVDMLAATPRSCRGLAAATGLDRMTVWRWRRLIAGIWAALPPLPPASQSGSSTAILRESRKASREWRDHQRDPANHPAPDRLRWIDYRQLELPLPEPMTRYRVQVRLAGNGECINNAVHRPARGAPCVAVGDTVSGHAHADDQRMHTIHEPDEPLEAATHTAATDAATGDEHVGSSISRRFRHFMSPFRGPATKHLPTYRAWFTARHAALNPR